MKKGYIFILSVLILASTGITIYEAPSYVSRRERKAREEYEAYMHEMYEKSLVVRDQFDNMLTYCKEHEEDLMKVSEIFLEQYYEDITSQETAEIAKNNASPEWTELSEKLTLRYPTDSDLYGKSVYYFCAGGGNRFLYIEYINADNEEIYDLGIGSHFESRKEKINDNLYVCTLYNPMFGL